MGLVKDSKAIILTAITRNPNWMNSLLMKVNIWPEKLYGEQYLKNRIISALQNTESKLVAIVNYAIERVPYYRNLYDHPITDLNDFRNRIGFINRKVVGDFNTDFISETINPAEYTEGTTGGTSGKPLRFLNSKNRHEIELAVMHNLWSRTGWNFDTRGVLRNHSLPFNKVYKINPITKEYIFDNYRLNNEYVKDIYTVLKRNNISFIHAYPSAAYQFCKLCKEMGLDLSFITCFLCGSESVMEFQHNLITKELGIKIYSWYGHSEKLVLGGYCEHNSNYHMEPSYGYFELIDSNNQPITQIGEVGEIVGTTLHNFGMPLIRYKTGDYAEYVGDNCPDCGREMPVIKNIQGRWDKNQILKKDGTYITTTSLNLHSDLYNYIDGIQYVQNQPGELVVLIVKNNFYNAGHEELLKTHFLIAMGQGNEVKIEYVESLVLQPNGKFELLINNYQSKALKASENYT